MIIMRIVAIFYLLFVTSCQSFCCNQVDHYLLLEDALKTRFSQDLIKFICSKVHNNTFVLSKKGEVMTLSEAEKLKIELDADIHYKHHFYQYKNKKDYSPGDMKLFVRINPLNSNGEFSLNLRLFCHLKNNKWDSFLNAGNFVFKKDLSNEEIQKRAYELITSITFK